MQWYVFYFILMCTASVKSIEFIYPIASVENGKTILLIYQKSPTHIELWFWNPKTNHIEQGLWSLFNPAGLQLLPDESGFSFIDNGRIRIKEFYKRSPKSIECDEPLYQVTVIHWIDDATCYLSAKQQDSYAIFQVTTHGTVDCVVASQSGDYMYPQKIEDILFYIERSKIKAFNAERPYDHYQYCIKSVPYPDIPRITDQDLDSPEQREEFVRQLLNEENEVTKSNFVAGDMILNFENVPIVFLTMISKEEGFVVEHPLFIESKNEIITFAYHRIRKYVSGSSREAWGKERLFSFCIPSQLLITDSSDRLYESLLPLLPKIIGNTIFFVDSSHSTCNSLDLFAYNLATKKINQKTHMIGSEEHCFVPLAVGNKFFIGGSLSDVVKRWIDDQYGMCVQLACFDTRSNGLNVGDGHKSA